MDWNATLRDIAGLSPAIGAAVGGPVGAAVGIGLKGIVQLITGTSDPVQQLQILQANPDKLVELEQRTRELESDNLKALLADRQDARHSLVSLAQAGSSVQWAPVVVSAIVLLGFFACVYQLFNLGSADLKPEQAQLLQIMLGALIPMAGGVVYFWTGSTSGSQGKDASLANSVPVSALPRLAAKP